MAIPINVRNRRDHSNPEWQLFGKVRMQNAISAIHIHFAGPKRAYTSNHNNVGGTISIHIPHNGRVIAVLIVFQPLDRPARKSVAISADNVESCACLYDDL